MKHTYLAPELEVLELITKDGLLLPLSGGTAGETGEPGSVFNPGNIFDGGIM